MSSLRARGASCDARSATARAWPERAASLAREAASALLGRHRPLSSERIAPSRARARISSPRAWGVPSVDSEIARASSESATRSPGHARGTG